MWYHTQGIVYDREIIKLLIQVVDYLFLDMERNESSNVLLWSNREDCKMKRMILWKTLAGSQLRNGTLKCQQDEAICLLILQGTKEYAKFREDSKQVTCNADFNCMYAEYSVQI